MTKGNETIVLVAEDDDDDRYLLERAAADVGTPVRLIFVKDGGELLDYLFKRNQYSRTASAPRPNLVLLDINLPIRNGLEALEEIREEESLRRIPVAIWSTSRDSSHVRKASKLGACSYFVKPDTFRELVESLTKALANCS